MEKNSYSKSAFVFPGQGSQSVGMLSEVAVLFPQVIDIFAEASAALGYDLWQLTAEGPEEKLNQTEYTQPALLAAGIAAWRICKEQGVTPLFLAGHSLGEYSALVAADAINFVDAIKLVAARGRLMQQAVAVGKGAMVAIIGLDNEQIAAVCDKAATGEILSAANFNSIGQTVLAGEKAAAERAVIVAKEAGAKIAKLLPVSVPSHCSLMQPAADELQQLLANTAIKTPSIPVISNVDVLIYDTAETIRNGLARQLVSPVRWVETILFLQQNSVEVLVECGPGKVLAGLNKRITKELTTINFEQIISQEE